MRTKVFDFDGDWALESSEQRVIQFAYSSEYGKFEPDTRRFSKTAACEEALAFASTIQPRKGVRVLLVSALGEMETWGGNRKSDAFPHQAIMGDYPNDVGIDHFRSYLHTLPKQWGYKVFPTKFDPNGNQIGGGNTFHEHKNRFPPYLLGKPVPGLSQYVGRPVYTSSDPYDTRCGFILGAFWNSKLRRVELIKEVWEFAIPSVVQAIDNGFLPNVSMACDIPFDRCSYCGHLAPTEDDYCEHLHPSNGLRGAVLKRNGRSTSVVMINDFPDFFDSSIVRVPADVAGRTLMKVASLTPKHYSFSNTHANRIPRNIKTASNLHKDLRLHMMQNDRLSEPVFSVKTANILSSIPALELTTYLGLYDVYPTGQDWANILYPDEPFSKRASIGYNADKYLLKVLEEGIPLTSIKPPSNTKLASNSFSIDDFNKVSKAVDPYLTSKSWNPLYDGSRSKQASNTIDLSVPFDKLDSKSQTIILLKIFTDKGLRQRIHESLVNPMIQYELEKHGISAITDNSNKPVYTGLVDNYINAKFYKGGR